MFVIMGVTGQVGGAALESLKHQGVPVRAVSRDPARAAGLGVETVRADASDTASLAAAFEGAEASFVMLVPPKQSEDVLAGYARRGAFDRRRGAHGTCAACRGTFVGRRASQRGQRHRECPA